MTDEGRTDEGCTDERLAGGLGSGGEVIRRGPVVNRPAPPNAPDLHRYLRALRRAGFTGAPEPVRLTPDGREEVTFLPGEVAVPPFPAWSRTAGALRSVGALLRAFHEASAALPTAPDAGWSRELADPEGGPLLCHNDVCRENVVFRDGRAAALIDFDLAAPGRPLWDVAMTARYWIPMRPGETSDAPARLRVLADGYGLAAAERAQLPTVIEQATAVGRAFVTRRVTAGEEGFVRMVADRGGWPYWDHLQEWLVTHRAAFTTALTRDT
ncbi:phosphotransferase [Streptomyces sp. JH002]|uniref:phosphotransferase n=1 Tax=Streptomyces sp. JH002 TaxID=2763259 RepID=UPI003D803807